MYQELKLVYVARCAPARPAPRASKIAAGIERSCTARRTGELIGCSGVGKAGNGSPNLRRFAVVFLPPRPPPVHIEGCPNGPSSLIPLSMRIRSLILSVFAAATAAAQTPAAVTQP